MNSEINWNYLFRILLIGDSGVGKSCILHRYTQSYFDGCHLPTIGVDFGVRDINVNNSIVRMQLWDTAGQERFESIVRSYYRGAHGVFITYDITNYDSFLHVRKWLKEVHDHAKENALVVLVGNKCDLDAKREVSKEAGEELAKNLGITFLEISAKLNTNVEQVFSQMATDLKIQSDAGKIILNNPNGNQVKKLVKNESTRSNCFCN